MSTTSAAPVPTFTPSARARLYVLDELLERLEELALADVVRLPAEMAALLTIHGVEAPPTVGRSHDAVLRAQAALLRPQPKREKKPARRPTVDGFRGVEHFVASIGIIQLSAHPTSKAGARRPGRPRGSGMGIRRGPRVRRQVA